MNANSFYIATKCDILATIGQNVTIKIWISQLSSSLFLQLDKIFTVHERVQKIRPESSFEGRVEKPDGECSVPPTGGMRGKREKRSFLV